MTTDTTTAATAAAAHRVTPRRVPRYVRRDYHPLQEGDTARAQAYLAVSPAVSPAVTARG